MGIVVPMSRTPMAQAQAGPKPSLTDLAIAAHMLHTEANAKSPLIEKNADEKSNVG